MFFNFLKKNKKADNQIIKPSKPQIISNLEQVLNFELSEVGLYEVWCRNQAFSKNEKHEITGLNLSNTQINDVSFLKELDKLQLLNLNNTQVSCLNSLNTLHRLAELYVGSTQINDISTLIELKNLEILDLGNTQINDISPLYNLIKLQTLNFSNTHVSNISTLSRLEDLEILNLNDTQVDNISPLNGLIKLQTLNFSNTHVNNISALSRLEDLQILNLNNTQVDDIEALSGLIKLQILNLNNTNISDVNSLNNLIKLSELHLSNTSVNDISILSKLENLTELYLSDTNIYDIRSLEKLYKLTRLKLGSNQLININPLKKLHNLRILNISNANINDVSPLSELNNLRILNLSNTQVDDIKPLSKLKNLQRLYLSSTKVSDVGSLANLNKLNQLSLSSTLITDISPINKLYKLVELYLGNTLISDITPLSSLNNLTELSLSNTKVDDISALSNLNILRELYLSNTYVSNINPLSQLHNLKILWLNETHVSDISPLSNLSNLELLNLTHTQVGDISALVELEQLNTLRLGHCKIKSIPLEIAKKFEFTAWEDDWNYGEINLYGNPIQDYLPPEIINKGQKAIITFLKAKDEMVYIPNFSSLEEKYKNIHSAPLNEVKTLIIGNGGCGKTSLVRCLIGQDFNPKEDQTHGIRILRHKVKYEDENKTAIYVNFWDFGGQEINHATHQFFYSKRSLYLLVLDAREERQSEYWLKYIENLGGDSPVLLVMNKIDENPAFEVNRRFLLEKYPNIKGFYRISCRTGVGIEKLRTAVHETLYNIELRKMQLSPSWFAVKEALTNMKENYISYEHYSEICRKSYVSNSTAREVLRELMHDLGVALDFKRLRRYDKQVLNPKWITKGVYRIINSPIVGDEGQGVLQFEALDSILHNWIRYNSEDDKEYYYPENTHSFITGIMQEFELCYELGRDEFIVPDLLPVQEPEGLDYEAHPLHFIIGYEDLLPRLVMPRFMVQMHHRIPEGTDKRWRTGVVIHEPLYEASAIIRADYTEKEIHIWVKGKDRRRMLSFIRKTLESIHASFAKLNVSEWHVIKEKKRQKPILVDYRTLIACDRNNNGEYFCPHLERKFYTDELLNGIETPESRNKISKIPAFISYSHKDENLKDEFKAHLKPLIYEYGLDLWDDREIDAGKQWEDEIITNLERAKLVFLLVSHYAIASDYIWQQEIPKVIQRHITGDVIVIPIILRPCAWTSLSFGKIQAVPREGKPITIWDNQNEAWLDTVRHIEEVLKVVA